MLLLHLKNLRIFLSLPIPVTEPVDGNSLGHLRAHQLLLGRMVSSSRYTVIRNLHSQMVIRASFHRNLRCSWMRCAKSHLPLDVVYEDKACYHRCGAYRRRTDYVPKMIQLAGGHYVGVGADEAGRSSVQRVSREAFFEAARDADVLIYNATVEAPLKDLAELKAKDELFADFKAVQAGEVYQLGGDMYQSADAVAGLTLDFYRVLHGETDVPLQYLRKLS